MRKIMVVSALAVAGAVSSCVTAPPPAQEAQVWGRADCQRAEGNPEVQQHFERARTICLSRGEAAAVAGTTSIPVRRGIGGATASGIERGTAQRQIGEATVMSCMAEQGYLRRTRTEHDAVCAAIQAQRQAVTRRPVPR